MPTVSVLLIFHNVLQVKGMTRKFIARAGPNNHLIMTNMLTFIFM